MMMMTISFHILRYEKRSAITGLNRTKAFHEVKVPRFHDNGTGWW